MSREIALQNIRLQQAPRWARSDYSMEYHTSWARALTGLDSATPEGSRAFFDSLGFDFIWSSNDGLAGDWLAIGRATDMGHAEYAEAGTDRREPRTCPFTTVEEVWAFDPDAEYGLPDARQQAEAYERLMQEARQGRPGQLTTGGYYKTIISGAIQAFGWEMLLEAAADCAKFERVLDRFFRRTLFHMEAWAATSAEVVIQHDDFVWTMGPFLDPAFYRSAIIPRFAELWKPLHRAGKTVLFCSDGNFTALAEDIVAAGADGLVFEPCNDFGWMVDRFGSSVCLVGSYVDCRDMAFGSWETVRAAVDRTMAALPRCRGAIVAVGNHIPANVPDTMLDHYFPYLRERLARG